MKKAVLIVLWIELSLFSPILFASDIFCDGKDGINTALGCIPISDTQGFTKWLLGWGVGIASGIAILLMIVGALMVIVSSGDPNKVKAGSELITSALAGLLFIIFSLFLLRLIGIEILQIPGL